MNNIFTFRLNAKALKLTSLFYFNERMTYGALWGDVSHMRELSRQMRVNFEEIYEAFICRDAKRQYYFSSNGSICE